MQFFANKEPIYNGLNKRGFRQEVDGVVESEIVPNWHLLDFIFSQEIEENV